MKNFIILFGIIVLVVGAYLDLSAITLYGTVFFLIGLGFLVLGVGLNYGDYLQFIRHRSAVYTASSIISLIKNAPKIFILFFLALSLMILVVSVLYRSSDAFQVVRHELAKDGRGDLKFGLIVTGSMSKQFDGDVEGRACFEFSAYDKTGGSRMKYCLVEKDNVWTIIE
jgi:hypothetical protein